MSESSVVKSIHVIPLKRVYFGRRTVRANRAMKLIRRYVFRHFKDAERVVIDNAVNEYVWSRNREKPPRRVIVEIRFNKEDKVARVLLAKASLKAKR